MLYKAQSTCLRPSCYRGVLSRGPVVRKILALFPVDVVQRCVLVLVRPYQLGQVSVDTFIALIVSN